MEEVPKSHCYFSYDEVIVKAQAIQPRFADDFQLFAAFDPWYTPGVNVGLLSGISSGLKALSESSLQVEIRRLKDLISFLLANSRHGYEKLKYFVDKTFGDAKVTNETFGNSDFTKARSSTKRMIQLLNKVHEALLRDDYEERLLAAYMPQSLPGELVNMAAELAAEYGELKILKKQHQLVTRERSELFNGIWDTLSKIYEDAKIIFANDPVRLAVYDLYNIEDPDARQVEPMEHL